MSVPSVATPTASAMSFWPPLRCLERNLLASLCVFLYTQQIGGLTIGSAALCAGLVLVALRMVCGTRVFRMLPLAVAHGMIAGIGITLLLSQLPVMLGSQPESHVLLNLQALSAQIQTVHMPSVFLGLLTIALLLGWQELAPAGVRILPGSVVALVFATLASLLLDAPVARLDLNNGFAASSSANPWMPIASAAVTLALLASVESLLPTVSTDRGQSGICLMVAAVALTPLLPQIPLAALAGLLVYASLHLIKAHHIPRVSTHREAAIYFATLAGVVGLNL